MKPIGQSRAFASVLAQIAEVAHSDCPVVLAGDTGTGKTFLARLIHDSGPRSAQPYVVVWPLLEFEASALAAARQGTLVFEEYDYVSTEVHRRMLEFLRAREFGALDAAAVGRSEARIILVAVAGRNGETQRQREAIATELGAIEITVPPLCDRREDIVLLAEHQAGEAVRRHALAPVRLSPEALSALRTREWPGNVRELAHVVECAVLLATRDGSRVVGPEHLAQT